MAYGEDSLPYYIQRPDDEEEPTFGASLDSAYKNDSASALPPTAMPMGAGAGVTPQPALTAPSVPVIDRSQFDRWSRAKQVDAVPTDRNDASVKPRLWERLAGGLSAAAMAYGHVPGALETGQNITDRRYNRAEEQRQGRLQADQTGLDAEQANIAAQNQEYDQRLKNFNAQDRAQYWQTLNANRAAQEQQRLQGIAPGSEAPDDPNNPLGTWSARTIGGQKIAVQAPDRFTKSPAGISAQREADVKRLGLKGDEAKYYRANGKLKEPTATTNVHIPSAESQEYNDWKKQFTQETGHAPTAADTQTYRHGGAGKGTKVRMGTPAQFSQLDKDTQAQYTKAEADYRVAAANAQTDEERAAALADLNVSKTKIGADHSDRLRDLGGIPAEDSQRSGGNAAPAPAAPPSQPAPKPAASAPAAQAPPQTAPQTAKVGNKTLKVGDPVQLPDGSQGIVTGINPQTGKPIVKRK